jgi:hypothetical protein
MLFTNSMSWNRRHYEPDCADTVFSPIAQRSPGGVKYTDASMRPPRVQYEGLKKIVTQSRSAAVMPHVKSNGSELSVAADVDVMTGERNFYRSARCMSNNKGCYNSKDDTDNWNSRVVDPKTGEHWEQRIVASEVLLPTRSLFPGNDDRKVTLGPVITHDD